MNPFFSMYVGEKLSPKDFVTIFSPFLVRHAMPLFHSGNVVVTGVQGSGKSMLLSLLKPDVRMQYAAMGEEFPVPKSQRKFLSSIVNLAHSNAIDFGNRVHEDEIAKFMFGDFLNYLVVENFLKNIQVHILHDNSEIHDEVGLKVKNSSFLDEVAAIVSSLEVWEGWIKATNNFGDLLNQIQRRNKIYRRYLHRKDNELDPSVYQTRTAFGEPISCCVESLFSSGHIDTDTNIFVEIDQYEELGNIVTGNLEIDYRAVVNRALATRNPYVSYRIGTRGWAWRGHAKIMGTEARLEEERDYKYVDLDLMLRRFENSSTYIWPEFAEDIFHRRLKFSLNNQLSSIRPKILDRVYGKTPMAKEKARSLIRDPNVAIVRSDAALSAPTLEGLRTLAKQEPLYAVLGEAWVRQKGDEGLEFNTRHEELPWIKRKYWRKERDQIALMQLASRVNSQVPWCGGEDIIELSGGCAAVFLSLNHFIWDSWLQSGDQTLDQSGLLPKINPKIQIQAILKASAFWVNKVRQDTGNSSERFRFVSHVSSVLYKKLIRDLSMSYPGHNGFSLALNELEDQPKIFGFLRELADYGNFVMANHTTKTSDGRPRVKFYFSPAFCPHFGLPRIRTKEPYYTTVKEVSNWLHEAGFRSAISSRDETQGSLF